ncbi:MAG: precorrin-6A/cobalt-precorrin-6A reductase [Methanothermococcus sp.]|nr:precorrin-6A/cobalt-precorrin-6A reductase [Methanothermococcus sp.]
MKLSETMTTILIMGGTSDANKIAEELKRKFKDLFIITTTTTDFGGRIARNYADEVISKPLDKEELKKLILDRNINILIDATHPFAVVASKNAMEVSKELNINYIRYERPDEKFDMEKFGHNNNIDIVYVEDFEGAAKRAVELSKKNIFYMAGIKNLKKIVDIVGKDRTIARILPTSVNEGLELLPSKNIVAMQGIFSKELNRYLIQDYNCDVIITKNSGDSGGLKEKVLGALEAGAIPIIIKRPNMKYPHKFESVDDLIKHIEKHAF